MLSLTSKVFVIALLLLAAGAVQASVSASGLLGARVADAQGADIGVIQDLAVDVGAGRVAYAIVEGKQAGSKGERLRAVRLTDMRPGLARDQLVLDPHAPGASEPSQSSPPPRLMRASTILGMQVVHPTGGNVGVVQDLLVDLDSAQLERAVILLDAGVPSQKRQLPFSALRFVEGSDKALLTLAVRDR